MDRSAVVASNGQPINSNRYIALMSEIALRQVLNFEGLHPLIFAALLCADSKHSLLFSDDRSPLLHRKYPGSTIVTDSVTSNGLSAFIKKLGGRHFRYRRGYKNVIGKGVELNEQGTDCQLMMETR